MSIQIPITIDYNVSGNYVNTALNTTVFEVQGIDINFTNNNSRSLI